jgi:hypothetical protein
MSPANPAPCSRTASGCWIPLMAASHSLLIRHLRLSGEEAQPDDDAGQDDDDEGATPGPTAGLPRHVTRLPSPPMRTTPCCCPT